MRSIGKAFLYHICILLQIIFVWDRTISVKIYHAYFYDCRWLSPSNHVGPEEAVQIHKDVGAKTSIGIHWGTFKMRVEV